MNIHAVQIGRDEEPIRRPESQRPIVSHLHLRFPVFSLSHPPRLPWQPNHITKPIRSHVSALNNTSAAYLYLTPFTHTHPGRHRYSYVIHTSSHRHHAAPAVGAGSSPTAAVPVSSRGWCFSQWALRVSSRSVRGILGWRSTWRSLP